MTEETSTRHLFEQLERQHELKTHITRHYATIQIARISLRAYACMTDEKYEEFMHWFIKELENQFQADILAIFPE